MDEIINTFMYLIEERGNYALIKYKKIDDWMIKTKYEKNSLKYDKYLSSLSFNHSFHNFILPRCYFFNTFFFIRLTNSCKGFIYNFCYKCVFLDMIIQEFKDGPERTIR
jgi:hypothetical protein